VDINLGCSGYVYGLSLAKGLVETGQSQNLLLITADNFGNTVSSGISIAPKTAASSGVLKPGAKVMLAGFGVGYSWGATLIRWGLQ
jgi:3-oxoacyl-[acyl-carrier-protein] synthase-3